LETGLHLLYQEGHSWKPLILGAVGSEKLEYNAKNLTNFDAVLFFTGGDPEMDAQQKSDFLTFIHDDGKGFIGIHSAAITFVDWPEYGEMIWRLLR
jgi:hypothetical protein